MRKFFVVLTILTISSAVLLKDKINFPKVEKVFVKPTPTPADELLLPDLILLPPKDLYITRQGTTKNLRFTTIFANQGKGPFEAVGHTDKEKGVTYADQYIRKTNGGGIYKEISQFVYHQEHRHWHVAGYVQYQLYTLKDGQPDQLLTSSDKQSVCLWDEERFDLTLPNAAQNRTYFSYCNNQIQGVSVGWSDIYRARIEGQALNISDIPDGDYLFRYIVNPDRKLYESDYENNSKQILINITGNKVTLKG